MSQKSRSQSHPVYTLPQRRGFGVDGERVKELVNERVNELVISPVKTDVDDHLQHHAHRNQSQASLPILTSTRQEGMVRILFEMYSVTAINEGCDVD